MAPECAWCGDDQPAYNPHGDERWYPNRRGETFCSRYHREASNAALRRLIDAEPVPTLEAVFTDLMTKSGYAEDELDLSNLREPISGYVVAAPVSPTVSDERWREVFGGESERKS